MDSMSQTQLQEIVLYHFLSHNYSLSEFNDSAILKTELRTPSLANKRQRIQVRVGEDALQANPELSFGGVNVVSPSSECAKPAPSG